MATNFVVLSDFTRMSTLCDELRAPVPIQIEQVSCEISSYTDADERRHVGLTNDGDCIAAAWRLD
jgi:hypothetical protein